MLPRICEVLRLRQQLGDLGLHTDFRLILGRPFALTVVMAQSIFDTQQKEFRFKKGICKKEFLFFIYLIPISI